MAASRPRAFLLATPAGFIATWFGSGLLPGAPGTWGSLAALPFAWAIAWAWGPVGLIAAALILFPIGSWAASRTARLLEMKDPGLIVVDEIVGQWLTLAAAPLDPLAYLAGFALFRFFDIVKPWPVSLADRRIGGGIGIMMDDVLAALYAAAILLVGRHYRG